MIDRQVTVETNQIGHCNPAEDDNKRELYPFTAFDVLQFLLNYQVH